jgi:hypothetical protein
MRQPSARNAIRAPDDVGAVWKAAKATGAARSKEVLGGWRRELTNPAFRPSGKQLAGETHSAAL